MLPERRKLQQSDRDTCSQGWAQLVVMKRTNTRSTSACRHLRLLPLRRDAIASPARLAKAGDTLGWNEDASCSCLSTVQFATGPKRAMGHVLGAEKGNFLIRGRGRPTVYGGRAGGILSIPAQEVSLGSPRVGTIHVQAPTPHTPPLQAFLADFSQQPMAL